MPGGQAQQAGTVTQNRQQTRDRMRIQTTQQQRNQFQTCTQSSKQVRDRIREMKKATRGQSVNQQQMLQLRDRLRQDLQTMTQQRGQLQSAFNEEQKAVAQPRLQEMARDQNQLEEFSEALGFELEQATLDTDRVRDRIRDMDKSSKQLQDRERDLGSELALD